MYKSNFAYNFISLVVCFSSIMSVIYIIFNDYKLVDGYRYLFILPLSFALFYFIFIAPTIKKYGLSLFLGVYLAISFVRYVVLSDLVVATDWYYGRALMQPSSEKFSQAIWLMTYELLVYNLAIYLFHNHFFKTFKVNNRINLQWPNHYLIYILFLLLTAIMLFLFPDSLNYFSFLNVNEKFEGFDDLGLGASLTTILINLSRLILLFLFITFIKKYLNNKHKIMEFSLISIIVLINSLVFSGDNRLDFIFNFIISVLVYIYLYRRAGKLFGSIILLIFPLVLTQINTHRSSVTITRGSNPLVDLTDLLQIYLGGIYNVAISLDIGNKIFNPISLLMDIFRSAIGPNLLLKNMDITSTTKLFNERIYNSDHVSQILPMIGQGNFYLGFIFAPFLGVSFIFLAVWLTKKMMESGRLELLYMFPLFSGRLGFVMAQNGNILLNDLTFMLPLFLLLYYLNNKVVLTK